MDPRTYKRKLARVEKILTELKEDGIPQEVVVEAVWNVFKPNPDRLDDRLVGTSEEIISQLVAARKESMLTVNEIARKTGMSRRKVLMLEHGSQIVTVNDMIRYGYTLGYILKASFGDKEGVTTDDK